MILQLILNSTFAYLIFTLAVFCYDECAKYMKNKNIRKENKKKKNWNKTASRYFNQCIYIIDDDFSTVILWHVPNSWCQLFLFIVDLISQHLTKWQLSPEILQHERLSFINMHCRFAIFAVIFEFSLCLAKWKFKEVT